MIEDKRVKNEAVKAGREADNGRTRELKHITWQIANKGRGKVAATKNKGGQVKKDNNLNNAKLDKACQ